MSVTIPEATVPTPAEREPSSLYKFAVWLHVGAGAEDCTEVDERAGTNRCGDPSHFHAWCRLPNQFQHREIQTDALAAKARRIRALRDPESTSAIILQDDVDRLRDEGEASRETIIEELLDTTWAQDYLRSVRDVGELEDPDDDPEDGDEPAKRFATIDADRDRVVYLLSKPPADRTIGEGEEVETINRHLLDYNAAVEERMQALRTPRRDALDGNDLDELCELVRRKRIKALGDNEFQHMFSVGEWLACTYRTPEGPPVFASLTELEAAPNDVIAALQVQFSDLERTAQTSGN